MGAIPMPQSPIDVVDTQELEELAEVIQLRSYGAAPDLTAVSEFALPVVLGAKVETMLLSNQHWDDFWIRTGGRLSDAWNHLTSHIWGSSGVSPIELRQATQLQLHLGMRFSRQLFSKGFAKSMGLANMALKGVRALARQALKLNHKVDTIRSALEGKILKAIQAAEHYADRQLNRYKHDVENAFRAQREQLSKWVQNSVAHPLQRDIRRVDAKVDKLRQDLTHDWIPDLRADFMRQLGPIAAAVTLLGPQVARLAKESEECTVPMCETTGPKTDWGKLLRKFSPALFWAMLAELAREDPGALETAAEELANVLGPVLETWTMAWLGLEHADRHAAEAKAAKVIGKVPFV